MKPLYLTVLLLVLQSTKRAHLTTSTASERDSSIAYTYSSSHFILRRLKRQSGCRPDQYPLDSGKCCKKCEPGTHLRERCNNTYDTQCVPCEGQGYIDSVNLLDSCFRCQPCQEGKGQEVETNCTKTSNTKCRCMSNHFCKTPEKCEMCLPCKQCDTTTEVVVQSCTKTNDTVCKAKGKGSHPGLFALVLIPIVVIAVLLYWKIKGLPCKRKKKSVDNKEFPPFIESNNPKPEEPVVPDIDLTEEILQRIAGEIEPKSYHQLGIRLGLGETKLQQLETDYRDNIMRQGYYVLYSWLQSHGKKGAFPKLIDALRKEGSSYTADKIMEALKNREENDVTELE
ncbi:tumor necrosis factor receptor superfamily member 6-like isoform X2 [Hypanus sabinus]|uniref:tumor necrosis factor receptor superfamily member 6-like isoform X2 n=1 Tax=Hypanus sabinus TaxID=79690 RepID=UPI0028C50664|nr:tumor necrosis factor receptor superfamily member 6-like isoform X2 [Hypanus sabinus]